MPRKTTSPRVAKALAEAKTETLMSKLDEGAERLMKSMESAIALRLKMARDLDYDNPAPRNTAAEAQWGRMAVETLVQHELLRRAATQHAKELNVINDLLAQAGVRPRRKNAQRGRKAGQ